MYFPEKREESADENSGLERNVDKPKEMINVRVANIAERIIPRVQSADRDVDGTN